MLRKCKNANLLTKDLSPANDENLLYFFLMILQMFFICKYRGSAHNQKTKSCSPSTPTNMFAAACK